MDNTVIKNLIYNQLFAAANYDLIATIAPDDPTKTRILNFSADCKNNANMLDRIYQEENTSSYHPIVQKPQFHGIRAIVTTMIEIIIIFFLFFLR